MTDTPSTSLLDYEGIQSLLDTVAANAAETHGTLCGLLCTANRLDPLSWADDVLAGKLEMPKIASSDVVSETLTSDGPRSALVALFQQTAMQMDDPEFGFYPFLPGAEAPLAERADTLAAWCQGFLYGLTLGGVEGEDALPVQAREVVQDISEISRLGLETEQGGEEEEGAYAEVLEYVRMAVLLVREELRPLRTAGADERRMH